MKTLLLTAVLGTSLLTATAAAQSAPQTPVTTTRQPVKKDGAKEKPAAPHHVARVKHEGAIPHNGAKAKAMAPSTKANEAAPATKPGAATPSKKPANKK